jgi:hypothetical protein
MPRNHRRRFGPGVASRSTISPMMACRKEGRMTEADTTPITPTIPAQGPVVFAAPPGGWTRERYRDAV